MGSEILGRVAFWADWSSGWIHCEQIQRLLVQTPLDIQPSLGAPPLCETPLDPWVSLTFWWECWWEIRWSCLLNNDSKLAMGQPNRKYLLKIVIFVPIFFNIYDTREKILGYMWGICAGFGLGKKSRFAKNIRVKQGKKLPTGGNVFEFCE